MTSKDIDTIATHLARAERAVAFTGAGISTESGLSDFRSPGGVWTRYRTVYYDEFLASDTARNEYWRMKKELPGVCGRPAERGASRARPVGDGGAAPGDHHAEHRRPAPGGRVASEVLELHGTGKHVECVGCGRRWPAGEVFERYKDSDAAPTCDTCGGLVEAGRGDVRADAAARRARTGVRALGRSGRLPRDWLLAGGRAGGLHAARGEAARGVSDDHQPRPHADG